MESTVRNMWKVVYDRKCGAVVMLSKLVEVCLLRFKRHFLLKAFCVEFVFGSQQYPVSFVILAGEQCAVLASCCW